MEQRVGFGPRLGAWLLDVVIVGVLAFLGGGTIGTMLGVTAGAALGGAMAQADSAQAAAALVGGLLGGLFAFAIAVAVIGCVYFLIEGLTGYTLGKLILGIRVASDDGTAAPVGKLLMRFAIKNSGYILTLLSGLAGIRALGTLGNVAGLITFVGCFFTLGMKKQAFHDMLAHTAVYPKAAIR
ncbi:MAG TPA: RDD family protein [Gemmatimonadales bacterium]|nr:RDD family protein [Gemmatimonadales bacterium]